MTTRLRQAITAATITTGLLAGLACCTPTTGTGGTGRQLQGATVTGAQRWHHVVSDPNQPGPTQLQT